MAFDLQGSLTPLPTLKLTRLNRPSQEVSPDPSRRSLSSTHAQIIYWVWNGGYKDEETLALEQDSTE